MTTAAAPVREWPTSIGEHKEALEKALRMDPEFAMWPEDTKIVTAAQPARIGKAMVEAHHPLLKLRRISYLWVESISGRGGLVLAKAAIASAKIKFFGKVEFIIEFNWTAWQHLSDWQRTALVDHELAHCSVDVDTSKPVLIPHEVEEFGVIIERYGLWQPNLERFAKSISAAIQGDLFTSAPREEQRRLVAGSIGPKAAAGAEAVETNGEPPWDEGQPAATRTISEKIKRERGEK